MPEPQPGAEEPAAGSPAEVPAPRPDPEPDPTLDLPLESPETATPVDPWPEAELSPTLWETVPAAPYPPPPDPVHPAVPATRPYPVAPQPPAPPAPVPVPPRGAPARPPVPPAGPPPAGANPPKPARRRRRWPLLLLLTLACCCGCPAYYGGPIADQYPATAALPARIADLRLRGDTESDRTARRLEEDTLAAHWLAEDVFAGVYTTSQGKRVLIAGSTGFRLSPERDLTAEMTRITPRYQLTRIESIGTGVRGRYVRCGVGRADGTGVVVCGWADHGSLATAVFTRLSVPDSANLLGTLRENIITSG